MGPMLFAAVLGCGEAPPLTDRTDGDADTDADSDADADADSDADTDSGLSTSETGAETAETGIDCTGVPGEDLEPYLEVRDTNGACTVCTSPVTLAAGFRNPCAFDHELELDPSCFVTSWSLVSPNEEMGFGDCPPSGGASLVTVPANGVLEQTISDLRLSSANWLAAAVVVTTTAEHPLQASFQVP